MDFGRLRYPRAGCGPGAAGARIPVLPWPPGVNRRRIALEIPTMTFVRPLVAIGILLSLVPGASAATAPAHGAAAAHAPRAHAASQGSPNGPSAPEPARTESPTPPIGSPDQMGVVFHKAPVNVALPDSVVARIFFSRGTADITRRQFVDGLIQLQIPPVALTPQLRVQVLDLLLQKRILSSRALRDPRSWTHSDSVNYNGLLDNLTLKAALDSAEADLGFRFASHGDTIPNREALGIMLRDSAVAALKPVYDEAMLGQLARAFVEQHKTTKNMSIVDQMRVQMAVPTVSAADSARELIHTAAWGSYSAGELLRDFGHLNPSYRPRVETADQVRDVANSVVYEKILRDAAVKQDLVHRPAIAAQLAERAEFLDVQSYVRRNAYDLVPVDSVTLRKHFDRHPRWFDTWARAQIVRGIFDSRAEADSFAHALALPGEADSLALKTMPSGMHYATYLTEDADTALFTRLERAGTRTVLGPDETVDGWRVIRATSIEPRRPRTFEQTHDMVLNDWYQRDGDRRVRELMQKLAAGSLVQVNDDALARVGQSSGHRDGPRGMPGAGAH